MTSPPASRPAGARPPTAEVRVALRATYVAFAGSGFAFASWAARIPQVRDRMHLSPASLGLVLLCVAGGSLLALPASGPVVARFGTKVTVAVMAVVLTTGLVVVAVGYRLALVVVCIGLFLLGFGNGAWDVAMNVQGALVERRLGRSVMPRLHAGYSIGTVAGASVGAAMVALGVSVTAHLLVVAGVVGPVVCLRTRGFLAGTGDAEPAPPRRALSAWRERRTVLVGVFVLAFAFAEGAGNDWIAVATIDGYHTSATTGTVAFALFLAAMTGGRWWGPALLDRHGRVAVVRLLAACGIAGTAMFVLGPASWVGFLGALLWGVGVSLGFPVGMSAGADEPAHAAGRVSVIASIGYCAFLGGPPAVGFLARGIGVRPALASVAALLVLSVAVSSAVAERAASPAS